MSPSNQFSVTDIFLATAVANIFMALYLFRLLR